MNNEELALLNNVNRAIIKFRGIYSKWCSIHQISYHEMLVLYTIREYGFCTQKQICDSYLLPKQTINNVISMMRKEEILVLDEEHSKGREKCFIFSEKGKEYAAPFLKSLDIIENQALDLVGKDKLQLLTNLLLEYDQALNQSLNELG